MIIFQHAKMNVHVWIGFTGKSKKENTISGTGYFLRSASKILHGEEHLR